MDLESLSKQELIKRLSRIYDSDYYDAWETLYEKVIEINKKFKATPIDIKSDEDKTFSNLVTWAKSEVEIFNKMDELVDKMSPEKKAEAKRKRTSALRGSHESFIGKR